MRVIQQYVHTYIQMTWYYASKNVRDGVLYILVYGTYIRTYTWHGTIIQVLIMIVRVVFIKVEQYSDAWYQVIYIHV